MRRNCVACGGNVGDDRAICQSCNQEGESLENHLDDISDETITRLERYFVINALRCPNCGDPHETVEYDGTTYTQDHFGIASLQEWQDKLEHEEDWIRTESDKVSKALYLLEDDWPNAVVVVRDHVL